jgi:hypothetical protein
MGSLPRRLEPQKNQAGALRLSQHLLGAPWRLAIR